MSREIDRRGIPVPGSAIRIGPITETYCDKDGPGCTGDVAHLFPSASSHAVAAALAPAGADAFGGTTVRQRQHGVDVAFRCRCGGWMRKRDLMSTEVSLPATRRGDIVEWKRNEPALAPTYETGVPGAYGVADGPPVPLPSIVAEPEGQIGFPCPRCGLRACMHPRPVFDVMGRATLPSKIRRAYIDKAKAQSAAKGRR
jgi:hypothetical protein